MEKHAGPSDYRPKNKATAPPRGRQGAATPASPGRSLGHPHEQVDKGAGRGRGHGKIKTTGKPRFERF